MAKFWLIATAFPTNPNNIVRKVTPAVPCICFTVESAMHFRTSIWSSIPATVNPNNVTPTRLHMLEIPPRFSSVNSISFSVSSVNPL